MRDTHDPSLYDLFHPHDAGDNDIEFYLELARELGGPILELGAGTGRSLLPLARAGMCQCPATRRSTLCVRS